MIEIVADRGPVAATVREITRFAGVSSRAFYQHFNGTPECFLRTYDLIVQRAARKIVASQAGKHDWQELLRLAFGAFAREVEREPQAARFALVEVYGGGPVALERIRHAESRFEAMLAEGFARAPDGVVMPPLLVKGIIAGAAGAARVRLPSGHDKELSALGDQLTEWALTYRSEFTPSLKGFDRGLRSLDPAPALISSSPSVSVRRAPSDPRALIVSATAKLAVAEGYGNLTAARIRAAAGVPPRFFVTYFKGVEDCFLAAVELWASQAFSRAAAARTDGLTWQGGIYRAICSLCRQIANDPIFVRLCFADVFSPGWAQTGCRDRFVSLTAGLLRETVPATHRPDGVGVDASAGAIWSVLRHQVMNGQTAQTNGNAEAAAFLALAPVIGAAAAVDVIRQEQAR